MQRTAGVQQGLESGGTWGIHFGTLDESWAIHAYVVRSREHSSQRVEFKPQIDGLVWHRPQVLLESSRSVIVSAYITARVVLGKILRKKTRHSMQQKSAMSHVCLGHYPGQDASGMQLGLGSPSEFSPA